MKEIGGYIELDKNEGNELYSNALALNCGRNAFAYLIEAKKYKKVYLPHFLCDSVVEVCIKKNVNYEFYTIDKNFMPCINKDISKNEVVYLVNYYGQLSEQQIIKINKEYNNIILDNAQAFFQKPIEGIDVLYTCRKYFGVPDGAYLFTDKKLNRKFDIDVSNHRMCHILGRFEGKASDYYKESVKSNKNFKNEPIKYMSNLTHNLLRSLDYDKICKKRTDNFKYLHEKLEKMNELKLSIVNGAFMYPLLINNGSKIRGFLQKQKIYVPILWPEVLEKCEKNSLEYYFADNILPLPCDQRYSTDDMEYIIEEIKKFV